MFRCLMPAVAAALLLCSRKGPEQPRSQPSCVSTEQATSLYAWLWCSCAPDLRSWHCQEQVQGWRRLRLVPFGAGQLHTALTHCMDFCRAYLPIQNTNPDRVFGLQFENLQDKHYAGCA